MERRFRRDIWGPCVILDTLYFSFLSTAGLGSMHLVCCPYMFLLGSTVGVSLENARTANSKFHRNYSVTVKTSANLNFYSLVARRMQLSLFKKSKF